MYMMGASPILMCKVDEDMLPFGLDTGAMGTNLYVAYYNRFRSRAKGWKQAHNVSFGAGGAVERKIYLQPDLRLGIGTRLVVLHNIPIYMVGTGSDTSYSYGNLGQDVVTGYESFTVDFTRLRFKLGAPLPAAGAQE